jgi:hypothetical protein
MIAPIESGLAGMVPVALTEIQSIDLINSIDAVYLGTMASIGAAAVIATASKPKQARLKQWWN